MLQLRVQKGAAAPTLSVTHSAAESLLDVSDVVMWRQDTSSTSVQVQKPSVGDTHPQFFRLAARHPLRGACPSSV